MAIYTTGTISISGSTATGVGTAWNSAGSLIRTGNTILVLPSNQVFTITRIDSATSMQVSPAASPAISAQKYAILLTDATSIEGLAQDIAETWRIYQRDMGGYADFMTGSGNITTSINGVSYTLPSLGALAKKGANSDITSISGLTTALSVAQGGTGAKNVADARSNLGLGNSATRDVGEGAGNVLGPGAFDLGSTLATSITDIWNKALGTRFCRMTPTTSGGTGTYEMVIRLCDRVVGSGSTSSAQQAFTAIAMSAKNLRFMTMSDGVDSGWLSTYHTGNTTRASDGTLKSASPVARIVKSQQETERTDVCEEGFTWCGCGTANEEAAGISIKRLEVGVYMLTGSAGLASEGWRLLPPMDPGGMGELGVVEAEETESGGITIRLFKRRYMMGEDGDIVKTKGAPLDVPANSWIDVRLNMPETSTSNQRNSAIPESSNVKEQDNQQGVISS